MMLATAGDKKWTGEPLGDPQRERIKSDDGNESLGAG
jgi:hypothetical protein